MNILCLVAVKDVWLDRSGISNSERKDWGKAIEDRLYSQSLWLNGTGHSFFSLFNPDVSILQSAGVEVPVYIHFSGHVFTTACFKLCFTPLEVQSVNVPLPLHVKSLGFIGFILASMHVQILESIFCNFIWRCRGCKNDRFHLARNIAGVLSQLFCLIDNIT